MDLTLEQLLVRSAELHEAIAEVLGTADIVADPRCLLAALQADIGLEHGRALMQLLATGHGNSAMAMTRLQLETTTRALWLLFAASDAKLEAWFHAVQHGALKEPNNLPSIDEQISQIEGQGPPGLAAQLASLKQGAWRASSSFVHGGIFALHERTRELPEEWSTSAMKNSNGLSIFAAMAMALSSGNEACAEAVKSMQKQFLDCGPPVLG